MKDKAYIGDEIVEGNILIASFMGGEFFTDIEDGPLRVKNIEPNKKTSRFVWHLDYNSSWDWLMPVVEKIRGLWNEESLDLQLLEEDDVACKIKHLRVWSEIDSVWQAVIQFITWYNNQNKQS